MPDLASESFAVAARLAARAEIRDVKVFSLSAESNGFPSEGELLRYEFSSKLDPDDGGDDDALVVQANYHLEVFEDSSKADDGGSTPSEPLAMCNLVVGALYEVKRDGDEQNFSEQERRAFAESTAQFALYPYARQLVSDLTSRIGLPPLILPILQLSLDKDPAASVRKAVGDELLH